MKITICASISFIQDILLVKEKLQEIKGMQPIVINGDLEKII